MWVNSKLGLIEIFAKYYYLPVELLLELFLTILIEDVSNFDEEFTDKPVEHSQLPESKLKMVQENKDLKII